MANIDNGFRIDVLSFDDQVLVTQGTGDPTSGAGFEAPVGSLYIHIAGVNSTIFIKDNTADIDWRDIGVVGALNNYSATTTPTTANDNSQGYSIGSHWVDTTTDTAYVCVDSSTGASVWVTISPPAGDQVLSRHNGAVSQTFSTTPTSLLFGTNVRMDGDYTYNAGVVTFTAAGTYQVSFDASYATTVSQLTSCVTSLYKNAAEVAGSITFSNHNSSSNGVQTASGSIVATFAINDTLEVVGVRNSGSGSLVTQAGGCRLNIIRLT